jgi:glutaredoxin
MKKFSILLLCLCTFFLSAAEVTLYYAPYCPYSREVLGYLNKNQMQIPMKNVKQDPKAKEELKQLGGVLEVPCLMVGDVAIYSSEAIIQWLKEHEAELKK